MGFFSRSKTSKSANPAATSSGLPSSREINKKKSLQGVAKVPYSNGGVRSRMDAAPAVQMPALPKIPIPAAPDPNVDPVAYLRSIHSVRERSKIILDLARENQLQHFDVDLSKFEETAQYVISIIKRDFAPDFSAIPPHGRWQHFEAGNQPRIEQLLSTWSQSVDAKESCRRLLDLFLVSVLLDAGAGTKWCYLSPHTPGRIFRRSEGLAIASLDMFKQGVFSSVEGQPYRVDAAALKRLTVDMVGKGFQVSDRNPLAGLEGRTGLLQRLGLALENEEVFGPDQRVGNILDYLLRHPTTHTQPAIQIPLPTLWDTLMNALIPIWPASRTRVKGVPLGDAWPLSTLALSESARPAISAETTPTSVPESYDSFKSPAVQPAGDVDWRSVVPFHKLTQWLTYSLIPPMTKLLNIHFPGLELMTGLPEYRNGGLFIDMGVLTLKPQDAKRGLQNYDEDHASRGVEKCEVVPLFEASDDVVVEWRAITVGLLDELLVAVNKNLNLGGPGQGPGLSLAQMLEAGSWKGGREIAEIQRPNTKEPPIMIVSDGTVF